MASKVVVNSMLGDVNNYVYAIMEDWSDSNTGPAIEGTLKIHDGKNTCFFHFVAYNDEDFQLSLDFLSQLQDNINVVYRELQMAYMDAKIRSANAEAEATTSDQPDSVAET